MARPIEVALRSIRAPNRRCVPTRMRCRVALPICLRGPLPRRRCVPTLGLFLLLFAAHASAGQQRPIFEAAVARVRVDVIVADAEGRFVDDLRAEDFVVFEDGEPQEVLGVQLVDAALQRLVELGGGPAPATADAAAGGAAPPTAGGSPAADANGAGPVAAPDLGAVVFLVDFPGLDWRNKLAFAAAWRDLVGQSDAAALPRAVYLIDQQSRLRELAPLTTDASQIREAAEIVLDTPLPLDRVARRLVKDFDAGRQHKEYERALFTFDILAALADSLAERGSRTALVWVSSGLTLCDPRPPPICPDPEILARQQRFHRAANTANVAVYTVDPSKRWDLDSSVADATIPLGSLPGGVSTAAAATEGPGAVVAGMVEQRAALGEWRAPLFNAAQQTSGRAFVAWAELSEVIREIHDDTSRYYLLTYAPPPPLEDGEYHDIRVEVRRAGVRVRARRGYIDHQRGARQRRLVATAGLFPGLARGLPIEVRAHRTWTAAGRPQVVLGVSVDPSRLGREYDEQGSPSVSIEVRATATDEGGNAVIAELNDAVRLPLARAAPAAGPAPIVRRYAWEVDPGRYGVRVSVLDRVSDRVGGALLEVEVPNLAAEAWRVSDPMLVGGEPGAAGQLVVGERVAAARPLGAYLEVYGGRSPILDGWVESSPNGTRLDLWPLMLRRGADGIHRGTLMLPRLAAGAYTLHLWLTDTGAGKQQSFRQSLEVVEAS